MCGEFELLEDSENMLAGQIPRNGLTWGSVCNSGGHIITLP